MILFCKALSRLLTYFLPIHPVDVMIDIISELLSAVLQVIVFSLIPFLVFLFRKRKEITFFEYIGLVRPTLISVKYAIVTSLLFVGVGVVMVFVDEDVREIVVAPPSVTGKIREVSSTGVALVLIAIVALVKTSFAEEVFFRGFVARRLMVWLGYIWGNWIQSLFFGAVHVFLFWKLMNPSLWVLLFIFALATLGGAVIGWIKEKYAHGSIVPGWIAHALGNTISYLMIVFVA